MKKLVFIIFCLIANICLSQTIDKEWKLFKIYDAQTEFELYTEPVHKATVTFYDTIYRGNTGANQFGGKLKYTKEKLFFTEYQDGAVYAKDKEKRLVEQYIMDCFSKEANYVINNDTLILTTKNIVLSFH